MRPRSERNEDEFIFDNSINKKPVRFDMAFSTFPVVPGKGVISIGLVERFMMHQSTKEGIKLHK